MNASGSTFKTCVIFVVTIPRDQVCALKVTNAEHEDIKISIVKLI